MKKLKIAFFSSEVGPFAKVGGLGDVAGSLPKYLRSLGVDITVFSGKYQQTDLKKLKVIKTVASSVEFEARTYPIKTHEVSLPGSKVSAILFEQDYWLSRGEIYETPPGIADPHYLTKRFLFLCKAGVEYLKKTQRKPDVLHANDWTTAPAVLLAQKEKMVFPKTKTLLTVHNITHGGFADEKLTQLLGLSAKKFSRLSQTPGNRQYFDVFSESLLRADGINTVSPTYARELLQPGFARGLEKVFQARRKKFIGILNGIDTEYFNPNDDPYIFSRYNVKNLDKKRLNKLALQKKLGLEKDKTLPVYSVITRLTEQKGVSLIIEAARAMMKNGRRQFIILGDGEGRYVKELRRLQKTFPRLVSFTNRYDTHLARQIYAGSDVFLMPSRFEPCGLTQMIAMRYGTLPVIHDTGGLSDTVVDWQKKGGDGFVFFDFTAKALLGSMRAAEKIYQSPKLWLSLQKRAMRKDFSWNRSAGEYVKLYKRLAAIN